MKLKCVLNQLSNKKMLVLLKPAGPKNEEDDDFYVCSKDNYTIDSVISGYSLSIDKKYDAYGIMYFKNEVRFLVVSEESLTPDWYPSELFEVIDSSLPYNWHCNTFTSDMKIGWIVGYKELAVDYIYLLDLMQKNPKAISTFNSVKDNLEYLL